MVDYPINDAVRKSLKEFSNIDAALSWDRNQRNGQGREEREIFRLLGNVHYPGIRLCLEVINAHVGSSSNGAVVKKLLQEKDAFVFSQRLAELYFLAFSSAAMGRAIATPAAPSTRGVNHDIDLRLGKLRAKVEIYSPTDQYGFQFVTRYAWPVFRYASCSRGFDVRLELIVDNQYGYHAYSMENHDKQLRKWLIKLEEDANTWLESADVGSTKVFEGSDKSFRLQAKLKSVCYDPEYRSVEFHQPSWSTDTKQYFSSLEPEKTARTGIGMRILNKMKKRQCGKPSSDHLRMLIVNFRYTDTYYYSWFWEPRIANQIEQTVRILANEAGDPLPYDVVLFASLDTYCCFGKPIVLDESRTNDINEIVKGSVFRYKCEPPMIVTEPPPPELLEALRSLEAKETDAKSTGLAS